MKGGKEINPKKKLLKDVAYEEIKKKILFENVKHMSENSLVKELNMSRTPIREALFKLQHEGFLEIISNQGIVVNDMSINRLANLIDMRIAIESYSMRQAINYINKSDFIHLNKIVEAQEESYKKEDLYAFRKKDGEFHQYLLEIAGNHYFLKMFSEVYELQFTARKKHMDKEEMQNLIIDHKIILKYLEKGKVELAIDRLTNHLNKGKNEYFRRN